MKPVKPVIWVLIFLLLAACTDSTESYYNKDVDDGDTPSDSDLPSDGDMPGDGDLPTDGDTPLDGDLPTDGDNPGDGDIPAVCSDFSGLYEIETDCLEVSERLVHVIVDITECTVRILSPDFDYRGTVLGNEIEIRQGALCSGLIGNDAVIELSCEDDCRLILSPASSSGTEISIQPSSVDFGVVIPGDFRTYPVKLLNSGEGNLNIRDIFIADASDPAFSIVDDEEWQVPTTIASGEELEVTLKCNPTATHEIYGEMLILSDAENLPVARVFIKAGVASPPQIHLDPAVLNFESTPDGYETEKFFLITNEGGSVADIVEITMVDDRQGAFGFADWSSVNLEAQAPFSIDPGFSVVVTAVFHPSEDVHQMNETLIGQAKVVWLNYNGLRVETFIDMIGKLVEPSPPCLEILPQNGYVSLWGDVPGPGINYGYVEMGAEVTLEVEIANCGDEPLQITEMFWQISSMDLPNMEPRAFAEAPGAFREYTLQRNESIYISIGFTPRVEGVLYASGIEVLSNAESVSWNNEPIGDPSIPITIGVRGIGGNRNVIASPSELDFGAVTVGCCSRPEHISLDNIGIITATINEIEILDDFDDEFDFNTPPQLPHYLGGSQEPSHLEFDLRFCPKSEGDTNASLNISIEGESEPLQVHIDGAGVDNIHQVDWFHQMDRPKLDILWVVDCSGSMGEEQQKLADNFETFIENTVNWDADVHIAITSCDIEDPSHQGRFLGDPPVISNRGPEALTDEEMIEAFQANVQLGTGCSGAREAGLEAAQLALSMPLTMEENVGFLRDDAKLAIIFVSDEEDGSIGNIEAYINFFISIKGYRNRYMLEVYAIVGDHPNGCSNPDGSEAAAGLRYIQVADACNMHEDRHFMSICDNDYSAIFDCFSETLFSLHNQFFLSRLADPDTIAVSIDGVASSGWEYDEVSNGIVFALDRTPEPGSEIIVEYDILCLH